MDQVFLYHSILSIDIFQIHNLSKNMKNKNKKGMGKRDKFDFTLEFWG